GAETNPAKLDAIARSAVREKLAGEAFDHLMHAFNHRADDEALAHGERLLRLYPGYTGTGREIVFRGGPPRLDLSPPGSKPVEPPARGDRPRRGPGRGPRDHQGGGTRPVVRGRCPARPRGDTRGARGEAPPLLGEVRPAPLRRADDGGPDRPEVAGAGVPGGG